MVDQTMFPPNPDNPDRAHVTGSGNDFVVSFTAGAVTKYLRQDGTWAVPPGGGGGTVWGGITGTLSNQTDLQAALDAKADASAISVVGYSGVYNDLTGKPVLGTVAALSYPGGTSAFLRADGTWQIPVDVQAQWGNISGTLSSQTDLQTALNAKAPLASPALTGTPTAPTAVQDTATTQLATTAFVLNQAGNSVPNMDGTGSSGASGRYARMDHVHPSDTSRAPLASPVFTGVPQAPTAAVGTNTTQIATTAFVQAALNGPRFSAYLSGDVNISDAVQTEVVLNTELYDTASCFNTSTGRFTPNVAGVYQINAVASLACAGGVQTNIQVAIFKNGTQYKRGNILVVSAGAEVQPASFSVSAQVEMNGTTDYISLYVYNDISAGTGVVIGTSAAYTWMDGFLITGGGVGSGGGGMTNPMTTAGDMIMGAAAGSPVRLAAGTTGQLMGINGSGNPSWNGPSGWGLMSDVITTEGDLIIGSSVPAPTRLGIGASGTIFRSNGTTASWATPGTVNIPTMAAAAAASGRIITSAGADRTQQDSGTLLSSLAPLASPALTGNPTAPTPTAGDNDTSIATTAFVQGERSGAVNSQSANYTAVLGDANDTLYHPTTDANNRTFTIPANASVAYSVGTELTFVNDANTLTIAINTDTLVLAGTGATGSRTLAVNGVAVAKKMTSTRWYINGTGLT